MLALRRGYGGRPAGSLAAVASDLYRRIRAGEGDLSKSLHLARPTQAVEEATFGRREGIERLRDAAWDDLLDRVDVDRLGPEELAASIICTAAGEPWLA